MMNKDAWLSKIAEGGVNAPAVPLCLSSSFLFIPSVAMRNAPEELVLELFQEMFKFEYPLGSDLSSTQALHPDLFPEDTEKSVLVSAFRGRERAKNEARITNFYLPVYPQLADRAWLSLKQGRAVRPLLLEGAIAQYLEGNGRDRQQERLKLSTALARAVLGSNSPWVGAKQIDILAAALSGSKLPELSEESAKGTLDNIIKNAGGHEGAKRTTWFKTDCVDDPLAERIYFDLAHILDVEAAVPRIKWAEMLKNFLRFAAPVWMLAHMRMTIFVRDWIYAAIESGKTLSQLEIDSAFSNRYKSILHPSEVPTNQIRDQVVDYIKARIELSILLSIGEDVMSHAPVFGGKKQLVTTNKSSANVAIIDLIAWYAQKRAEIKKFLETEEVRSFVIGQAEQFKAWTSPVKKGQGKNYHELLIVLRRGRETGTDEGYLLSPIGGRGTKLAFRVFPGDDAIWLFGFLALAKKRQLREGRVLLKDLEDHFYKYGINFGESDWPRGVLISRLVSMNLLKGSPDAGSAAEIFESV